MSLMKWNSCVVISESMIRLSYQLFLQKHPIELPKRKKLLVEYIKRQRSPS
jgi:hypothetical protein